MGIDFYPHFESSAFLRHLDVIILAVPLIDLEATVNTLSPDKIAGKLIVDVSPLNAHPKNVLLKAFANQPDVDILVTNPMFGPAPAMGGESSASSGSSESNLLDGRPMAYERVRISDIRRCEQYLKFFEDARCQVMEMDSEQHDASTADAEFVTHMVGRLLDHKLLPPTPIMSHEYSALNAVAEMTAGNSFDAFFGMFKYNKRAKEYLMAMRENLADVERKLAARDAYLTAKAEMKKNDRQLLLAETKLLLQELVKTGLLTPDESPSVVETPKVSSGSENLVDGATSDDLPQRKA
jgi:arogenate dehydrogenase (NADP+)